MGDVAPEQVDNDYGIDWDGAFPIEERQVNAQVPDTPSPITHEQIRDLNTRTTILRQSLRTEDKVTLRYTEKQKSLYAQEMNKNS